MDPNANLQSTSPEVPSGSASANEKPRIKMQLYKTEPCQNWALYGTCRYGNLCKFAHGMNEQRSRLRHPMYKTSLCKDFPLGKCTFGNRCNFAHSVDELRVQLDGQLGIAGGAQLAPEIPVASVPKPPTQQQMQSHQHQQQYQNQQPQQMQPQQQQLQPQQQQPQSQQLQPQQLQPPSQQQKKFQKRHKQQQLQALLQTPITMLPDGRLLSTFTPVTANAAAANATSPSASNAPKAKGAVASTRNFGELRRYQSMGTLRTTPQLTPSTPNFNPTDGSAPLVSASALALQNMNEGILPASHHSAFNPLPAMPSPLAATALTTAPIVHSLAGSHQSFAAFESSKQSPSLQHLQQDQSNVARRVASLSQLPSLRTAPQASSSADASFEPGVSSGNLLLQGGFQLSSIGVSQGININSNNNNYHHHHTSSLAHAPFEIQSPVLSSPSFRENDESFTPPGGFSEYGNLGYENDFARLNAIQQPQPQQHQPQQHQPQPQQPQQQQHIPHATQRRMLTSSVSMQTLPRFKVPVSWEQPVPKHQPQQHLRHQSSMLTMGTTASSAAQPSSIHVGIGSSSQSSAATLIDSDVWSNTPQSSGFTSLLDPMAPGTKPHESRFFPATTLGSSGFGFGEPSPASNVGTFSVAATADPLGIYYPHTRHQQLRRQQSTDDWMLLRRSRAYGSPTVLADSPSPAALAHMTDNRLTSLDQLRAATVNRKQFNPSLNDSSVFLF
ncbi:hypothetical protein GGI25_002690 [Coemansia spiralis]|uniref:C3H1-type domain-containing protein n=2 Tax=Coemansia TaxID=4863 RepID=A0A9W8G7W1_9FUNG|nr:hypothetical protein EDC05_002504 [Coemansia umbellata]KAJ2622807.1 hypothetical protein GGI26_002914 [Coemansia sp. RSA 1358]KAJ2678047.1 hypothetical protein GGI25_002690 [Coemansia spiralis]